MCWCCSCRCIDMSLLVPVLFSLSRYCLFCCWRCLSYLFSSCLAPFWGSCCGPLLWADWLGIVIAVFVLDVIGGVYWFGCCLLLFMLLLIFLLSVLSVFEHIKHCICELLPFSWWWGCFDPSDAFLAYGPWSHTHIYIYTHIYICIHIYIYICCGVIIWAKFGLLTCYYLGQVAFHQNTVCQTKHYKNRFSALFWKKLCAQSWGVIIWAKGIFALKRCAEIPIFIVFFEHQPKLAKKMGKKTITFHILQNIGSKKNRFVATPLLTQNWCFSTLIFWNQKHWCWTKNIT